MSKEVSAESTTKEVTPALSPDQKADAFYGTAPDKSKDGTSSEDPQAKAGEKPAPAVDEVTKDAKDPASTEDLSKEEPSEAQKAAELANLVLPKDALLDVEMIKEVANFAKENNLSAEVAQAILENQNDLVSAYAAQEKQKLEQVVEGWRTATLNDPVIGGANIAKSADNAKKVITRFGNEELKKYFNESGAGNHPEIVRMLSKIGEFMSDDTFITGSSKPQAKSAEELFYGKN